MVKTTNHRSKLKTKSLSKQPLLQNTQRASNMAISSLSLTVPTTMLMAMELTLKLHHVSA